MFDCLSTLHVVIFQLQEMVFVEEVTGDKAG